MICAIAAYTSSFYTMLAGRLVFGLGGESIQVVQNLYTYKLFKHNMLNTVFGVQMTASRGGSALNFYTMEALFHEFAGRGLTGGIGLGSTLMVSAISTLFGSVCAVLLAWLSLKKSHIIIGPPPTVDLNGPTSRNLSFAAKVKSFPCNLWVMCGILVCYYSSIFTFVSMGQSFFVDLFKVGEVKASFITGLPYLVAIVASPLIGILVDAKGRNSQFVLLAVLFGLTGYILPSFKCISPYVGVAFLSTSYSFVASALWPIVSLLLPEDVQGTAYGMVQSLQNAGMSVLCFAGGKIVDIYGFKTLDYVFIGVMVFTVLLSILFICKDMRSYGFVGMSAEQRKAFQATPEYNRLLGTSPEPVHEILSENEDECQGDDG